jgi:FlaG/FlaF family flagellin (archaellin)
MIQRKGISPLIADTLLIALVIVIGALFYSWSSTLTRERIEQLPSSACIGALDIGKPEFDNGTITMEVRNRGRINLTGLKAYVVYANISKNKEYVLSDYNFSDPLLPQKYETLTINTSETTKPESIEVVAANCVDYPAKISFIY